MYAVLRKEGETLVLLTRGKKDEEVTAELDAGRLHLSVSEN